VAERPGGTRFVVRLTPRGGRDGVDGVGSSGELRVRVAAPPVDGAANTALLRLLGEVLGVPPSAIVIEAGATGRTKRIRTIGLEEGQLKERWPGLVVTPG
jgi:uncharacterized protein